MSFSLFRWLPKSHSRRSSGGQPSGLRRIKTSLNLEPLEVRLVPSGNPHLLKDINTVSSGDSNPSAFVAVGGTLLFTADDGVHGTELWRSDGTTAGTVLVKDINPGSAGSGPYNLTEVNGKLYFTANDGTHGGELWKSNGTAAGTVLVKDINPGSASAYPDSLTNVNGTLFFGANDGTGGNELWKSNGTAAGTVLVKDINPGSSASYPYHLTNVNGTLFFEADDGTHGQELWKSNGTAAGTALVKDINPGGASSDPQDLTNGSGMLFFEADDGTHGEELWKSDGTAAGTVLVKDINRGGAGSHPYDFTDVHGMLFFTARDDTNGRELWKSDGTGAGTVLVKDINPGGSNSYPSDFANVNGTLFFGADDGTNGRELWKSDGTEAGTALVADINPGGGSSFAEYLTNVNGTLFFEADDGTHGVELWRSDGTAGGTALVSDINPNGSSDAGHNLTLVNGVLFFTADDGFHGFEPWILYTVTASGVPITASAGNPFSGTVATIADRDPAITAGDFTATILWGDGQTSAGTVAADGHGSFTVSGTHTYAAGGTYPVVVKVATSGGDLVSTPTSAAGVADWWRGEGNALDSAGGAAGTLVGGVTFAPGVVGRAFQFNGAGQYVQLPDNIFPFPTAGTGNTPFSFQTWFETTAGGVILGQLGPDDGSGTPQGFVPAIYVDNSGLLRVQMFWSGSVEQVVSAQPVNDGAFHHVAVSYDGATERVYLDGAFLGSTPLAQLAYAATYRYRLGSGYTASWPGGNGGFYNFTGLIDEAALFTGALSPEAIRTIYAAGSAGIGTPAAVSPVPTAGVSGPADGVLYQPRTFTFTTSDTPANEAAGFTYQINWGDGSPLLVVPATANNTSITETHAYTTLGTFTVIVTATNQFGAQSSPAAQTAQIGQAQLQAGTLVVGGVGGSTGVVLSPGPTAGSIKAVRDGTLLGTFIPAGGQITFYGDTSGADQVKVVGVINAANTFTLGGSTATFTAASFAGNTFTIALNSIGRVTFVGGKQGNTFTNAAATVASVLQGGTGGANTFTFAGSGMGAAATIMGAGASNTLKGPDRSNVWKITGANAGTLNGTSWHFTGVQSLVGGSALDSFAFTASASKAGSIDGGGGGDWLDYTAYPGAVTANLATGQATGVTGTVSNIQNVFGGSHGNTLTGNSQGNILGGGSGADTITGGTGVSLLMGGGGSDTVTGGSGGDILVGGTTTYDHTKEAALLSILAEWQRTDRTYTQRIADLKNGGGLNHANKLVYGTTVKDDGAADTLTGGTFLTGALDWFFAGPGDSTNNLEPGEQIN